MKSVYISPLTLLPKFQAKNVIRTPPCFYARQYLYIFITTSGYYLYDNVGCTREPGPLKYRQISQLLQNKSFLEDDGLNSIKGTDMKHCLQSRVPLSHRSLTEKLDIQFCYMPKSLCLVKKEAGEGMLMTSFYSSQLSEGVGENKPHGKQLPICGLDHLKMDPKIVC